MRPGISNGMLARAGVQRVSAAESMTLCGEEAGGLWLPYRDPSGGAIMDGNKPYGRLRLDRPKDSKKYHQAAGTTVHVYLPPEPTTPPDAGGDLFIIEGEFKSLSLAEAGFAAVGISGFYGFAMKGGAELVPELAGVTEKLKPARIFFCGDSDTALNSQFAVAAVRLAKLLQPIPVWLPRMPRNGPGKGADDCREVLKESFPAWWQARLAEAIKCDPKPSLNCWEWNCLNARKRPCPS